MRTRHWIGIAFAVTLGIFSFGCGDNPDDAGNQLVIGDITPESGKEGYIFPAVDQTDDEGCDGDAAIPDGDGTQNNRWPDTVTNPACLESITKSLDRPEDAWGVDLVDIELRNEARPGVPEGRPLVVTGVQITYFTPDGNTPAYAPQRTFGWSAEVPSDGTATLTGVPLTSLAMKVGGDGVPGLRDIFFDLGQGPIDLVAQITVFAEDTLNNESVSASTRLTITFINPN
ncbi:MAG: hypothetical protein IH608_10270 [Proteobacteria bacterium]|nr:hypothetical protein [Pseudomonadota bacterium]